MAVLQEARSMGIITRHPASILHLEKKGEFQIYSRPCSCFYWSDHTTSFSYCVSVIRERAKVLPYSNVGYWWCV